MSAPLPFNEDYRDCIQEVCNVAMGVAGEALANFTNTFVELSIPVIRYIEPKAILEALDAIGEGETISGVAQGFSSDGIQGCALAVVTESSLSELAQLVIHQKDADEETLQKLLNQMSEQLIESCLAQLAESLALKFSVEQPDIIALHQSLESFVFNDIAHWDMALSVEINFRLEAHNFNCDLLILLPDESVEELTSTLNILFQVE